MSLSSLPSPPSGGVSSGTATCRCRQRLLAPVYRDTYLSGYGRRPDAILSFPVPAALGWAFPTILASTQPRIHLAGKFSLPSTLGAFPVLFPFCFAHSTSETASLFLLFTPPLRTSCALLYLSLFHRRAALFARAYFCVFFALSSHLALLSHPASLPQPSPTQPSETPSP